MSLPKDGTVFISVADRDKTQGIQSAILFKELGFSIAATVGTAEALRQAGLEVSDIVAKIGDDDGVTAVELIESGKVQLVINSPREGVHVLTEPTSEKLQAKEDPSSDNSFIRFGSCERAN